MMEDSGQAADTGAALRSGTPLSSGRRAALAALFGGAMLSGMSKSASAQVVSSVDTVPLQFVLNMQYLTTNFLQVVTYGAGRQLPADYIRAGEFDGDAGVSATTAQQVQHTAATRQIESRIREIADEDWYRTIMLRDVLRGDAPAQKMIDYTAQNFTKMFQLAGAIPAGTTFDPYASPTNLLLATETLLTVRASVYTAILPSMTNDIALAMMGSMGASAASNATTVRAMLYEVARTDSTVLPIIDKLAAWRDQVDGTSTTDKALSPTSGTSGQTVSRLAITDSDGLYLGRTPQQALNVLFMTSASVTQGGFFPTGINGGIVRSAAN